jgi:hypothetical protein
MSLAKGFRQIHRTSPRDERGGATGSVMTRQEIEQKMDALAREYHDTHDPEIREEIYRLGGLLDQLKKETGIR